MGDSYELAGQAQTNEIQAKLHNPTVTERLEQAKSNLTVELNKVNEALDALKANPEIERVMNLVQRASGRI